MPRATTAAPADTAPADARARFWPRYAAWSLDAACLLPLVALSGWPWLQAAATRAETAWQALVASVSGLFGAALATNPSPMTLAQGLLADPQLAATVHALSAAISQLLLTPLLLYLLLACAWSVGFEASAWRATPGKRALGMTVVDARGQPLRPVGALLRFLAAGLSWLSLNLGHALALLSPQHLALHDHISGSQVLGPAKLPAWARGWLLLQVLAFCIAGGWLFLTLRASLQVALEQALGMLP